MGHPNVHVVIPDTQIRPDVPFDHLAWAGWYIGEQLKGRRNVTIVHLGDHWDMPSLSSYDRGKKAAEGRRYADDIAAGNMGFGLLDAALREAAPRWKPRKVVLRGNHEDRITRAANDDAWLDGAVSLDHTDTLDWEVHGFLEPVWVDGVCYSHYFYPPNTSRPYGGHNIELRLTKIGHSFTMGHQQGLLYGVRSTLRGMQHGLVCGSFYQHDEEYRGPQQRGEWRGIVICHEVEDGHYDPMFVSLGYLARRYSRRKVAA